MEPITETHPETSLNITSGEYEDHPEDEEGAEEADEVQEWDEGGPSHCGYSESVHETLMAVGQSVHSVVGEPSGDVEHGVIKSVGNWFQEASYAVRDFVRGNKEVEDDTSQAITEMKQGAMAAIYGETQEETPTTNENEPAQQQ